jgi:hypothetical protein
MTLVTTVTGVGLGFFYKCDVRNWIKRCCTWETATRRSFGLLIEAKQQNGQHAAREFF